MLNKQIIQMRRILILVYSAFLIIMLANYIYYKSLYNKQISYIIELLDRQVQIVGISVDSTNNGFVSEFNEISFSGDLSLFFTNPKNQNNAKEKMKTFFSKYNDFVTGIKLYDNNKNEFTLKKDDNGEWLEQPFTLHVQGEIFKMEKQARENKKFNYYLPVIDNQKKQSATLSSLLTIRDTLKLFLQNSSLRTINGNGWSATPEKLFTTIIRIRFYTHNWIKSHQGWLRDLLRILCTKLQLMVKRKN